MNCSTAGDDDDEDDSIAASNPEVCQTNTKSLALLAYFVWLSASQLEEIDFQLMEQYLADGADINAATEMGATILHDVAMQLTAVVRLPCTWLQAQTTLRW